MDYIVYGGGHEVATAFRSVALFFNHMAVKGILAMFVTAGIGYSLFAGGLQGFIARFENKDASNGFSSVMWTLFGAAIFTAGVLKTTTLHVYDEQKNAYSPVGNVPILLAYVAGGFNDLEEAYREIVGVSGSNHPVLENGTAFKLLYEATGDFHAADINYYLHTNIADYYDRCVIPSKPDLEAAYNSVDQLLTILNGGAKPGWYMDYKSSASPDGDLVTCAVAYARIETELNGASDSMRKKLSAVCKSSNYDDSVAAQKQACIDQISQAANLAFKPSGSTGTIDHELLFQNSIIANGIREAMMSEGTEGTIKALVNRSMMSEGMATNVASDMWIPIVKAVVTATVIALSTILFPLLATPLFGKVLKLFIGLYFFVIAWNMADLVITGMMMPAAIESALNEISQNGMGLAAMWLSPGESLKALALLGDARTSSMNIAVLLTASITGVSAYGLSSYGQRMTQSIDKSAEKAADDIQPEKSGALLHAMGESMGQQRAISTLGLDMFTNQSEFNASQNALTAQHQINALGGDVQNAASQHAEMNAGDLIGKLSAIKENAELNDRTILEQSSVGSAIHESQNQGAQNVIENESVKAGQTATEFTRESAAIDESQRQGNHQAIKNTAEQKGIDVVKQANITGLVDGSKAQGNTLAIEQAAQNNGKSVAEQAKNTGLVDGATEQGKVKQIESEANKTGKSVYDIASHNGEVNQGKEIGGARVYKSGDDAATTYQTSEHVVVAENKDHANTAKIAAEKNGDTANPQSGFDHVAAIQGSDNRAKAQTLTTSEHQGKALLDAEEDAGKHFAKVDALDSQGTNPFNVGYFTGRLEQLDKIGQAEASKFASDEQLVNKGADTVSSAVSNANEKGDNVEQIAKFNQESAERGVQKEKAANLIWNAMKDMGLSKEELGIMTEGANTHIALTPENKGLFYENDLISREQYDAVGSGARMDFSATVDDNGKLVSLTSSVASGDKSSVNNSHVMDESSVLKMNVETGDQNSTRELMKNPEHAAEIYAKGGAITLADKAAMATSSFISETSNEQSTTAKGGQVGGGFSGPPMGWTGSASASVSYTNSSTDSALFETQKAGYLKFVHSLEAQADKQGLTGIEKDRFVGGHLSGLVSMNIDQAARDSQEAAKGGFILESAKQYADANNLTFSESGVSTPAHIPKTLEDAKTSNNMHPQGFEGKSEYDRATHYSPPNSNNPQTSPTLTAKDFGHPAAYQAYLQSAGASSQPTTDGGANPQPAAAAPTTVEGANPQPAAAAPTTDGGANPQPAAASLSDSEISRVAQQIQDAQTPASNNVIVRKESSDSDNEDGDAKPGDDNLGSANGDAPPIKTQGQSNKLPK